MGRLDPFWDQMCPYRDYIWLGVMVMLFLLILSIMSLLLAPRGTASFLVAAWNFLMVLVVGSLMLGMYRYCLRYERSKR